jgi:prepilin-type N-terminal cleavage/methylation domain-containing protein
MRSNKKGFTLIELLAVIAILAILVIVAVPNVINMYRDAKSKTFITQAKNIYSSAEQKFMADQLNTTTSSSQRYCHSTTGTDDNPLNLSGNKNLYYDITIDASGNFTAFKVIDASYSLTTTGTAIDITQIDTVDAVKLDTTAITCTTTP